MRGLVAAVVMAGALAAAAFAADAEVMPERKALLISILEDLGCRVDGVSPPPAFLDAMEENRFVREETNAIADELVAEGKAERDGNALVLKTENCA